MRKFKRLLRRANFRRQLIRADAKVCERPLGRRPLSLERDSRSLIRPSGRAARGAGGRGGCGLMRAKQMASVANWPAPLEHCFKATPLACGPAWRPKLSAKRSAQLAMPGSSCDRWPANSAPEAAIREADPWPAISAIDSGLGSGPAAKPYLTRRLQPFDWALAHSLARRHRRPNERLQWAAR